MAAVTETTSRKRKTELEAKIDELAKKRTRLEDSIKEQTVKLTEEIKEAKTEIATIDAVDQTNAFLDKLEKEAKLGVWYLIEPSKSLPSIDGDSVHEDKRLTEKFMVVCEIKVEYPVSSSHGVNSRVKDYDGAFEYDGDYNCTVGNFWDKVDDGPKPDEYDFQFFEPKYDSGEEVNEEIEDIEHNGDHKNGYAKGHVSEEGAIAVRKREPELDLKIATEKANRKAARQARQARKVE